LPVVPLAFHPFARRLAVLVLFSLAGSAFAAEEVEVTSVRFANVRSPIGANGMWLEADVALNVRPPPGAPTAMVSRVKVSLLVGFELPAAPGGERRLEHYRAEAECVALDAGRANVRFYLPPELVKRDQLHGDPKYWGVELAVAGHAIPPARNAYATTLSGAEQRKSFQTRAGAAAAPNDGLLQPQYLTPFAHEYPRATPSFVRREVH
jgi:hypothetical protein